MKFKKKSVTEITPTPGQAHRRAQCNVNINIIWVDLGKLATFMLMGV